MAWWTVYSITGAKTLENSCDSYLVPYCFEQCLLIPKCYDKLHNLLNKTFWDVLGDLKMLLKLVHFTLWPPINLLWKFLAEKSPELTPFTLLVRWMNLLLNDFRSNWCLTILKLTSRDSFTCFMKKTKESIDQQPSDVSTPAQITWDSCNEHA